MNGRVGVWDGPHFAYDFLERVLLGQHIKQIIPFAYHFLDSLRVQKVRKPHPVKVAVGFHLEYELTDVAEAEAAVPPRISQDIV